MIFLDELLKTGVPVIAGVSGGADSVCLLLMLAERSGQMDFPLYCCHVEHGIRGESSRGDEAFVEELCGRLGIEIYIKRVDVPAFAAESGLSVEEAARIARRSAYVEAAGHFAPGRESLVALAHHAEDNAETVLLNLVRGTGAAGLCGMGERVPLEEGRLSIIRPLLRAKRAEIESFLRERGQAWRTDETNAEDAYARNKIRNRVLPILLEINPRAVDHINDAAQAVTGLTKEYSGRAETALRELAEGGGLSTAGLARLEPALRQRCLALWLADHGGLRDITRRHYRAIEELLSAPTGRGIDLPGRRRVRVSYGTLLIEATEGIRSADGSSRAKRPGKDSLPSAGVFEPMPAVLLEKPAIGETITCDLPAMTIRISAFELPDQGEIPKKSYAKWFDYDKINSIMFRNRRAGDSMVINNTGGRKSIRRLFIDEKLPRDERDSRILLADGEGADVIWVPGLRESMAFHISESTKTVLSVEAEI